MRPYNRLLVIAPKKRQEFSKVRRPALQGEGQLVASFVAARNRNAALKLLNLTRSVNQVMNTTKLLTVFESFEDEAAALQSFSDS